MILSTVCQPTNNWFWMWFPKFRAQPSFLQGDLENSPTPHQHLFPIPQALKWATKFPPNHCWVHKKSAFRMIQPHFSSYSSEVLGIGMTETRRPGNSVRFRTAIPRPNPTDFAFSGRSVAPISSDLPRTSFLKFQVDSYLQDDIKWKGAEIIEKDSPKTPFLDSSILSSDTD